MKAPLTKEQRAEMRERFMLGEYTPEDVQDVFERLEAADLATAKLATARVCAKCDGKGELSGYKAGNCPHCTNGVVFDDSRALELLSNVASLKAAVGFRDDILSDIRESIGEEGLLDIQVPDRITELLERLKRVEEDSKLLDWLDANMRDCVRGTDVPDWYIEAPSERNGIQEWTLREAIRAARAK